MKVNVYSMETAQRTMDNEHLISIRNPAFKGSAFEYAYNELDARLPSMGFASILVIECDDVTSTTGDDATALLFNQTDARKIIAFVKGKENIAIHCNAGMSRSVAVGTFLRDYFNADVTFTVTGHDNFRNIHIVNTLRRIFLEEQYGNAID